LWDATQPERILLHAGGVNEISICATGEKQSGKRHYREEQRFYCPNFADVEEQKRRSHNHPFLGKSLEAKYHLDLPISTVNRSSDTNRVGPVSLAQWTGCDFVFSPLGSGNSQLSEPVDARLLPDAPLISLVC
jgi:hypothetical protein